MKIEHVPGTTAGKQSSPALSMPNMVPLEEGKRTYCNKQTGELTQDPVEAHAWLVSVKQSSSPVATHAKDEPLSSSSPKLTPTQATNAAAFEVVDLTTPPRTGSEEEQRTTKRVALDFWSAFWPDKDSSRCALVYRVNRELLKHIHTMNFDVPKYLNNLVETFRTSIPGKGMTAAQKMLHVHANNASRLVNEKCYGGVVTMEELKTFVVSGHTPGCIRELCSDVSSHIDLDTGRRSSFSTDIVDVDNLSLDDIRKVAIFFQNCGLFADDDVDVLERMMKTGFLMTVRNARRDIMCAQHFDIFQVGASICIYVTLIGRSSSSRKLKLEDGEEPVAQYVASRTRVLLQHMAMHTGGMCHFFVNCAGFEYKWDRGEVRMRTRDGGSTARKFWTKYLKDDDVGCLIALQIERSKPEFMSKDTRTMHTIITYNSNKMAKTC